MTTVLDYYYEEFQMMLYNFSYPSNELLWIS